MSRCLATLTILTIIPLLACTARNAAMPATPGEEVKFSCVVFNGPSSVVKFEGQISSGVFTKWFRKGYGVGGERIETPLSATAIGALILKDGDDLLVMPLCTWTIESGHNYFACQSDAIGNAPMFSVCTESKTIDEFLDQMERKMSTIVENVE